MGRPSGGRFGVGGEGRRGGQRAPAFVGVACLWNGAFNPPRFAGVAFTQFLTPQRPHSSQRRWRRRRPPWSGPCWPPPPALPAPPECAAGRRWQPAQQGVQEGSSGWERKGNAASSAASSARMCCRFVNCSLDSTATGCRQQCWDGSVSLSAAWRATTGPSCEARKLPYAAACAQVAPTRRASNGAATTQNQLALSSPVFSSI